MSKETTVKVKAWSISGDDWTVSVIDGVQYITMTQEKADRVAKRIADLESQLTEARRHNELLRAVANKARKYQVKIATRWASDKDGVEILGVANELSEAYQAAIDGGPLEDDTID